MSSNRLFLLAAFLALLPLCRSGAETPPPKFVLDSPTLTAAERFVLAQVRAGKIADLQGEFADATNRVLRAAFLEAVLTQSGTNVHRNGVSISHAVIPDAFDLRNAEVQYDVSLAGCRFAREVDFSKSIFANGISLAGSTFDRTVTLLRMKIGRAAVFDQATFEGDVSAAQMEITGLFTAGGAHFNNPTGRVDFTSLKVKGDATFAGATFAGPVSFESADIEENFRFEESHFAGPAVLVSFAEVKVGANTSFAGAGFAGYVSFKDATFAGLDFSKVTWAGDHNGNPWLWLNGMTYQSINAGSEKDSWQNLYNLVQRTAHGSAYSADIFSRLEEYYRQLGYPRQANTFFRAKKIREREEVLSGLAWVWSFFLDQFVGYGRSPERAFFWSVAIVGFGCVMFRPRRMELQSTLHAGRRYSPFWYSVDLYLPIIKLHDVEIWKPREECVLTHVWRRIHTVLGWALIPIALAAWTGMLSH